MAVTIQVRRDTAANWTSVNPVLHQGELGLETDTGKVKIGNGSTVWTSLAYGPAGLVQQNGTQPVVIDNTVTHSAAPFTIKGDGTSTSQSASYYYQYGPTAYNIHKFRMTGGSPGSPSAAAANNHVHFFDWSAYDGASVATASSDGLGYGGGVAESYVEVDATPPQAGSGHTPGRFVIGVTPAHGDPTGSATIPSKDPGPADQVQLGSGGYLDVAPAGARGVTVPTGTILAASGDVLVAPMGTPVAPTVTAVGNVTSAHTYTYKIVPVGTGNVDGPPSPASNTVSNDVLNGSGSSLAWTARSTTATVYNSIQPAGAVAGAQAYRLLVSVDSGAFEYLYTYQVGGLAHYDDGSITAVSYTPATAYPGGHLLLDNVTADPATPSGGGSLYVVSGALKFKGTSGTAYQISPPPAGALAQQQTAIDFALQNGTPTVITWTTPNDGNEHRAQVFASLNMSSGGTGGQLNFQWTYKGSQGSAVIFAANATSGTHVPAISTLIMADPNTAVRIIQSTALTAGAGEISAEVWAS